jgi:hypothetical protein
LALANWLESSARVIFFSAEKARTCRKAREGLLEEQLKGESTEIIHTIIKTTRIR